jgi:hypothetical protein
MESLRELPYFYAPEANDPINSLQAERARLPVELVPEM